MIRKARDIYSVETLRDLLELIKNINFDPKKELNNELVKSIER